ncbi:MAG: hypothetical protein Q9169_004223, partial [Polycauliona sp. 2 TL-2023]
MQLQTILTIALSATALASPVNLGARDLVPVVKVVSDSINNAAGTVSAAGTDNVGTVSAAGTDNVGAGSAALDSAVNGI